MWETIGIIVLFLILLVVQECQTRYRMRWCAKMGCGIDGKVEGFDPEVDIENKPKEGKLVDAYNVETDKLPKNPIYTSLEKDYQRFREHFNRQINPDLQPPESTTSAEFREDHVRYIVERLLEKINVASKEDVDLRYVTYRTVDKQIFGKMAVYEMNVNIYDKKSHLGMQVDMKLMIEGVVGPRMDIHLLSADIEDYPRYEDFGTPGADKIGMKADKFEILNDLHLFDPWLTEGYKYVFTEDDIKKFIEERTRNRDTSQKYLCFNTRNVRAESAEECTRSGGTWDRPVTDPNDCPFYLANKNYPNRRGGLRQGGRCEMPANVQIVGYRHFRDEPIYRPLCYNCHQGLDKTVNSIGMCCEEQKNRALYPNLRSPDYMFPGDLLDRQRYGKELDRWGLRWKRF